MHGLDIRCKLSGITPSTASIPPTITTTGWKRPFRSGCSSTPSTPPAAASRTATHVKVYNDRGALILPCRLTDRIMPGVIDIPQGAWYAPDEQGTDRGGCVNVLTSHRWTPFAFATAQHTIMVQVEKADDKGEADRLSHLRGPNDLRLRPRCFGLFRL